ncbi:TatD family hydrolase [Hippea maritima]|uniref:Hydrolase, TatD family n=1 Tax=Hippea maritima (strain ATCC 700847 / DSM 10411 / MH2) TaxID=760142 RepID=F2LX89_HIPMA|nr:TatD family hydrolase [Hippea maritima]AEA33147.1 hydrolase, TatD family [Hippea maritima DSM 10411]
MYKIIDTHCHIDMEEFEQDRDEVIQRSKAGGVDAILVPAVEPEDFDKEFKLTQRYETVYQMVGIHPHEAKKATQDAFDRAIEYLNKKKCVGIGEIGLDYYYEHSPRDIQKEVFANFLDIATENGMPVSIHCREAERDLIDIIRSKKDLKGVIHCFSGNDELLKAGLDLGLYFGIGGILTFKKSTLKDVVKEIPLEFIVFETDAPYLAPVPKRGKRNEPLYIYFVIDKMAEITGKDAVEISDVAYHNASSVFSLGL